MDLYKDSDMVNRDILLGKLYHYSIRGISFDLIKSLLSNRKQYVKLEKFESKIRILEAHPLTFIIYIDLTQIQLLTLNFLFFLILFYQKIFVIWVLDNIYLYFLI